VVERARHVQDFLEVRFALETTSSYLTFESSTLSEWEFISEIAERADIGLLFDVNNGAGNAHREPHRAALSGRATGDLSRAILAPTHIVTRRGFPRPEWHSGSSRLGDSDRGLPRSAPSAQLHAAHLGLRLPEYVESQTALEHHRLCSDMARLELAYLEIFDAADAAPISPEALAEIAHDAWPKVRIAFHPALRLLKTEHPVAPLRRKLIEARASAENVLMPGRDPQCQLLFRRDLQLFHEPISEGAYALLGALTRRVPLVAACEQAQAEVPVDAAGIAAGAAAWFQSWAARGLVVGVDV
jgi:hypothetical protein